MRNRLLLVVVIAMLFATSSSFAQHQISLGGGADILIPMGTFGDVYSIGFGGDLRGQYMVDDQFSMMLTAGFLSFSVKDSPIKLDNATVIPILAGAKYFFQPSGEFRPYGALELGISIFKQSFPSILGVSSVSSTEFTYAPALGFEYQLGSGHTKLDAAVRFNGISDANSFGARVGLVFGLPN